MCRSRQDDTWPWRILRDSFPKGLPPMRKRIQVRGGPPSRGMGNMPGGRFFSYRVRTPSRRRGPMRPPGRRLRHAPGGVCAPSGSVLPAAPGPVSGMGRPPARGHPPATDPRCPPVAHGGYSRGSLGYPAPSARLARRMALAGDGRALRTTVDDLGIQAVFTPLATFESCPAHHEKRLNRAVFHFLAHNWGILGAIARGQRMVAMAGVMNGFLQKH